MWAYNGNELLLLESLPGRANSNITKAEPNIVVFV